MTRKEGACLICGEPLVYFQEGRKMECQICQKTLPTFASCSFGYYVCDQCHAQKGVQVILEGCKNSSSKNPIALMQELMENPFIYYARTGASYPGWSRAPDRLP